ncbi:MAG: shikimate dehydrogenase [Desulfovibrionaceae bacterium]|nr:shikimate dehydrogenase [Desulfovibrionaceae bacterium]
MMNSLRRLGVIGDPIAHTLSPLIQNGMLKALDLQELYEAIHITPDNLHRFTEMARAEFTGFNATMPHKAALLPLMDELSADAVMYQAVNTVSVREGKLFGCNTDGEGFLMALKERGIAFEGGRIVILGAGGAARSVALKLAASGAERIVVCCRSLQKAEQLTSASVKISAASFESIAEQISKCDLLINCTPLGMDGVAAQFSDFSFLDFLPQEAAVCDLIYRPQKTQFLSEAGYRGHVICSGLGMLIYQAILALEQFLQTPLDLKQMREAVEQSLYQGGILQKEMA